jgi:AraC-like DNA-binding protein
VNISQQILFLTSALGAFNGFVLSMYLFLKKGRSIPALFLGIFLLAISIRVGKSVFVFFNPQLPKIFLQIGLSGCFLIGPALYFFLYSSLKNTTQVPVSWKWHWGILATVLVLGGISVPYAAFPWTWNHIVVYIIYGQWLLYMIAAAYLVFPVLKGVVMGSSKNNERFLMLVFAGSCIVFIFYLLAFARVVNVAYIIGPVVFSFFLYLTILFYLHNAGAENALPEKTPGPPAKPEKKKISESDAQVWIAKLEKVLQEKKLYKDPNLKLTNMAKEIGISPHLLSQLLNENMGKSFSTYINEYRVEEACRLIGSNGHLSFEAIGYEVGYNSKSTFYTSFKKIKDTTPALFKESIENRS